jgi:hypothetical protein
METTNAMMLNPVPNFIKGIVSFIARKKIAANQNYDGWQYLIAPPYIYPYPKIHVAVIYGGKENKEMHFIKRAVCIRIILYSWSPSSYKFHFMAFLHAQIYVQTAICRVSIRASLAWPGGRCLVRIGGGVRCLSSSTTTAAASRATVGRVGRPDSAASSTVCAAHHFFKVRATTVGGPCLGTSAVGAFAVHRPHLQRRRRRRRWEWV